MVAKKGVVKPAVKTKKATDDTLKGVAKGYMKSAEDKMKKVKSLGIKQIIKDLIDMILNPVKCFTSIKEDGNFHDAVTKILIYGVLAGIIQCVFGLGHISLISSLYSLIAAPIYALLIAFAIAGVLFLFSYMCKGEMKFETSLKAVANCMFIYPLSTALYQFALTYWMLFAFSLMVDLYIVFLIYVAITSCLKASKNVAHIVFGVFAAFVIILHFSSQSLFYLARKNPQVVSKHFTNQIISGMGKNLNIDMKGVSFDGSMKNIKDIKLK